MRLQFGISVFERARGDLPQLPVINMFAEKAPTEEGEIVLQSRPGISEDDDLGDNVQATFRKDGVFNGDRFNIVDGVLYREAEELGSVDGPGPYSIDGYSNFLFAAGGGRLGGYDGDIFVTVVIPDVTEVGKVVIGASRAIIYAVNTGRFYWSSPLTSTIDALSFATAESQPDNLRDLLFIDDTLVPFGAETVEFWPNTGNDDLPFQPLEGRVFERGVRALGCAAIFDAEFVFVGDDNVVYGNGAKPVPLSNEGLQEKIAASTDCRLWTFQMEGTEFLALRLDTHTYVYSNRSRLWSEFASAGQANWLPQCWAAGAFGTADGKLASFNTLHTDFDGTQERRFRAGAPLNFGGVTVSNVILRVNAGQTPYLTGDYDDPVVEMRMSRDGGVTWGAWKSTKLGQQGKYRHKVQWAGLGMFGQPGVMLEFRTSDPVPFRVADVRINEPFGGL